MNRPQAPPLPDGIVAFVKRDCPTCPLVAPALARLASRTALTVGLDRIEALLRERGVPGVFVATVEFIDGAERQARALGGDPAAVFVEHPTQDRTDAEMIAIADGAFEKVLAVLVADVAR